MTTLAERIADRLRSTGKRAADLARHTGVKPPTVSKWLSGQTKKIEWDNLVRAAEFLECNPAWLAEGTGSPERSLPLRPIAVWENEADLPPDQYVFLPKLEVKLSAGDGKMCWHIDEAGQRQAFTAKWARRMSIDPECAATMVVDGDSMEPRIQDGDSIVVDYCQNKRIIDGKVYAIILDDELYIKRLFKEADGSVRIVSDNQDKIRYPDKVVQPEHIEKLQLIGRVVGISGAVL